MQSLLAIKGSLPTWQWLAPEVISGTAEYDERADIYSYAVVLWELATDGQLPFEEYENEECFVRETICEGVPQKIVNGIKIREAVVHTNLRPSIPEDCPPTFSALIQQCWSGNPADRPRFPAILDIIRSHIPLSISQAPVLSGLQAPSETPSSLPKGSAPPTSRWTGSKTFPSISENDVPESTRQRWLTAPSRPKRRSTFLHDNRKTPKPPTPSGWISGRVSDDNLPNPRLSPLSSPVTNRPNRIRRSPSVLPNAHVHERPAPMHLPLRKEVSCLLIVSTTLWVGTSAGEIHVYSLTKVSDL